MGDDLILIIKTTTTKTIKNNEKLTTEEFEMICDLLSFDDYFDDNFDNNFNNLNLINNFNNLNLINKNITKTNKIIHFVRNNLKIISSNKITNFSIEKLTNFKFIFYIKKTTKLLKNHQIISLQKALEIIKSDEILFILKLLKNTKIKVLLLKEEDDEVEVDENSLYI